MEMGHMKLTIRRREDHPVNSAGYEVKLNDWELGRGVTNVQLSMEAGRKPKVTIECFLDELDVDDLLVDGKLLPLRFFEEDQTGE